MNNDNLEIEMARWAKFERTGVALDEDEVAARLNALKQRNGQTRRREGPLRP
jgi:hypothetical protein